MKPIKTGRTANSELINPAEKEFSADDAYNSAVQAESASFYERSWRHRVKEQQADLWIAVGLYLVICSVAFVVF